MVAINLFKTFHLVDEDSEKLIQVVIGGIQNDTLINCTSQLTPGAKLAVSETYW
jgi:hypothetical protein